MQNLDPASTQHTQYVKWNPRDSNKVDSFSIYTTLLKLMAQSTEMPVTIKKQANEHYLRTFNFEM